MIVETLAFCMSYLLLGSSKTAKKDKKNVVKPIDEGIKRSGDKDEKFISSMLNEYIREKYPDSTGFTVLNKRKTAIYSRYQIPVRIAHSDEKDDFVAKITVSSLYEFSREKKRNEALKNGTSAITTAMEWFSINRSKLMETVSTTKANKLSVARFSCELDDAIKDDVVSLLIDKFTSNVEYNDDAKELWITV